MNEINNVFDFGASGSGFELFGSGYDFVFSGEQQGGADSAGPGSSVIPMVTGDSVIIDDNGNLLGVIPGDAD